MKQILLLAAAIVSVAQLGVASPCTVGTLASYVALGSTGCSIGGDTLYNFQILPGSNVTELSGSSVTLSAMGGTYNPGITISINQSAVAFNAIETMFTYDISGPTFTGISSALGGSSESTASDGVTGIVNYCDGGSFGPDGVDGCTKPNGSLLTVDGVQNSITGSIANVSFINVTDDFMLDSGGGTAKGGTLTNSFTAVPEPVNTALAGLGLALAGALRFRSMRASKRSSNKKEED